MTQRFKQEESSIEKVIVFKGDFHEKEDWIVQKDESVQKIRQNLHVVLTCFK